MKEKTLILAIESSCDETAVAVIEDGHRVLANLISSQIDLHQKFGGVVPEIASRKHLETINLLIRDAMEEAGCTFNALTHIAVANTPGLIGALLVGVSTAKALAYGLGKPLIAVNHIEGHMYANFIKYREELTFPLICLLVSGGHTMIVKMTGHGAYQILGNTRDDAVGEAFDKVARTLGIGYPGGPVIDRLAQEGNEDAIPFPRAVLEKGSLDFSYSGLKSAVLNYINQEKMKGHPISVPDVCASFQKAAVSILVEKTLAAAEAEGIGIVMTAGGVSANSKLRSLLSREGAVKGIRVFFPEMILCTDNAAMIGAAAHYKALRGPEAYAGLDLNGIANFDFSRYVEETGRQEEGKEQKKQEGDTSHA